MELISIIENPNKAVRKSHPNDFPNIVVRKPKITLKAKKLVTKIRNPKPSKMKAPIIDTVHRIKNNNSTFIPPLFMAQSLF